jgi:hypothetical protein
LYIGAGFLGDLAALLAQEVVPAGRLGSLSAVLALVAGMLLEPSLGVGVPTLEVARMPLEPVFLIRTPSCLLAFGLRAGSLA